MFKKFFATAVFAFAFALATTAGAVYQSDIYTPESGYLKVGSGMGAKMSQNDEVKAAQTALNACVAGASLNLDGKFGPLTKGVFMSFQASKGIKVDGIIGPVTAAQLAACSTGTTPTPTPTPAPTTGFSGTEGSVDTWSEGSADNNNVREGETNKEVYQINAELANDGDLLVDRLDVYFGMDNAITASAKPWEYFTEVSLTANGDVVATNKAMSSSDWTEYDTGTLATTNQEYRMRFSGFSKYMTSDRTTEWGVRVSVQNTIDTADQDAEWQIGVTTDSFKVTDGKGFSTSEGVDAEDEITFGSTKKATIDIRDASTNPDATVIEIDSTEDTNGVTIYQFEIEESNDVKVSKIEEMTMTFTTTVQTDEAEVIRRAYLYDGSTQLGSEIVATGGAVTFDNLDLSVNADSKKTITVKVDLDDVTAGLTEASTITVGAPALTKFEDANGNDEGDITETVSGGGSETHELRSSGIQVTLATPTAATKTFTADATTEDDQGTYTISFNVKAFGADMYIDKPSEVGGANAAGQGVEFMVRSTAGTPVLSSDLLTSSTTVTGDTADVFKVEKDSTRTFTLTVIYAADSTPTDGSHEVYLESINWGTSTAASTNTGYYTLDLLDYKSGYLFLNGIA